jgi:hypothetical protein
MAAPGTNAPSVYVPAADGQLLGGSGEQVDLFGDLEGAEGDTVQLAESQVTLGAIRPYQSVLPEYEASARQSLARQPLPSGLESLVQRYFAAIATTEGASP